MITGIIFRYFLIVLVLLFFVADSSAIVIESPVDDVRSYFLSSSFQAACHCLSYMVISLERSFKF